jgi:hypothetical protein
MRSLSRALAAALLVALVVLPSGAAFADGVSKPFAGTKANTGTVTLSTKDGVRTLTLSTDFVPPDTPDPHWQVVDSKGNAYLLNRLFIKPDKTLRTSVTVPAYVGDIAKVQMWCAWAETLLGEASFEATLETSKK